MPQSFAVIAADDHLDSDQFYRDVPDAERERCIRLAIEEASEMVANSIFRNVVIFFRGSLMAMVRWNIDSHPPVEVARFADELTLC